MNSSLWLLKDVMFYIWLYIFNYLWYTLLPTGRYITQDNCVMARAPVSECPHKLDVDVIECPGWVWMVTGHIVCYGGKYSGGVRYQYNTVLAEEYSMHLNREQAKLKISIDMFQVPKCFSNIRNTCYIQNYYDNLCTGCTEKRWEQAGLSWATLEAHF